MLGPNEIEQVIRLINKGFSLELLALELGLSPKQIQSCYQQLELRKFAKQSVNLGKIPEAIEKLTSFIESSKHNIVERVLSLKLQAYTNGECIDDELEKIEKERKHTGFSKDIDEILDKLDVQIPKKKNSNIRKKIQSGKIEKTEQKETVKSTECKPKTKRETKQDYEKAIKRYQEEIAKNPQKSLNKRNILAFAYFKSGRIIEARDELMSLIDEHGSYIAYRQLIHIEKSQGNFEDARFWADACLEQFPDSIDVRHQLASVAIEEGNHNEAIKQLRKILSISPENQRGQRLLATIDAENQR